MANTSLKFYKVLSMPSTLTVGGVYFNESDHTISVATSASEATIYAGIKSASVSAAGDILTLVNSDGTTVKFDMSGAASASAMSDALNKKVDKVSGKGLSTNDYTTDEKNKLAGIADGAQVNKIEIVKVNGSALTIGADKSVDVTIANNVVKSSADTTANYIPKFTDTKGTIANGYSVQTTLSSSATAIPTAAAVASAIDSKIAAADAMIYKGTLGTSGTVTSVPSSGYKTGWTYKVITAGNYAGVQCEIGDMLIAVKDATAGNTSVTNSDWTVVQANLDGAVTGPNSSTNNHIAVFDGATGKVVKDSGFTIGVSVPSDAKFTDTNTKVTSVDNHYKPSNGTSVSQTAGAAVGSAGKVITGVTADAAGHITGVTTGTIPATPTLAGLGGISSIEVSGTAPLTLSKTVSGTTVSISGNVANMKAASSSLDGSAGLVPAPTAGKQTSFLRGDGTWAVPTNTNTTYTFANGTDGSFSVTPSGGSAQKITIGKPSTAGTADKVGHSISIQLNGGTATSFDGSADKSINITPASIGAVTSEQVTNQINDALVWTEFK